MTNYNNTYWVRNHNRRNNTTYSLEVDAASPVRTQQALLEAVTMVGEFDLARHPGDSNLYLGDTIRIDQLNVVSRVLHRQFTGQFNTVTANSKSSVVRISCTGYLARLRRISLTDYELTGMTDTQAARFILEKCNIPFDPEDISGWGYVLGQRDKVIWEGGKSGADMLSELDRVFFCATTESGSGRVQRFHYHLSANKYEDDAPIAAQYLKGDNAVAFYDNDLTQGDADQIFNYWKVLGYSWSGETGAADEGVNYQIYAKTWGTHPILGEAVYVGPQEFSSDLIQSEDIAKAIAQQLIEQSNREPNKIRIEAGNNPQVTVGSLILVNDPTPGIFIYSQRYLVTDITREGDFMSLEALGREVGNIDFLCSFIQKDVVGTNPAPSNPADGPKVPKIDDPELDVGDPFEPYNNCQIDGAGFTYGGSDGAGPPAGADYSGTWIPWRDLGLTEGWAIISGEATDPAAPDMAFVERYDYLQSGYTQFYYNTTEQPDEKTAANDYQFPINDYITISGCFSFYYPGAAFAIRLGDPMGPGLDVGTGIFFYAEPGTCLPLLTDVYSPAYNPPTCYGIRCHTENDALGIPNIPANHPSGENGSFAAAPFPLNTEIQFTIGIDTLSEYNNISISTSAGGTYMRDKDHWWGNPPSFEQHYDLDCGWHTYHNLWLAVQPGNVPITPGWRPDLDHPTFTICGLSLGLGTCEPNAYYTPPVSDEGVPSGEAGAEGTIGGSRGVGFTPGDI